mmetsp:Transcript_16050/g.34712  ORF Transcript_16050/g.34712 Transcript_16050/m.34712 type:complete len:243 (-) Transcript_16050:206-934(-)|eukprot:CAMPEP_0172313260 /NCGR_PEP_ID=MMETSP1058-20130122/19850_1 /TAXON_ID=83371 /ORGANISM="Detonula confervacea, Strain CCMP 353" /LENGTH=242 /DNA_ID=CAMNT_0013026883 /DNA_START=49 /DNA_END=777 /DNA_ORIENTATION=+
MSSSEAARNLLTGNGGTTPLKLEYFAIEGVAEQIRIALSVAGVPFDDVRIPFSEWPAKKPTTKYGQLPEMILPNGMIITESMAMLRLAGEADSEGKLYPADIVARVKVEEVLGLVGDLGRAWRPAMYVGMRPQALGHPPKDEWADADATIEKMRSGFIADELPKYMGYFADLLKEAGGDKFLTGEDLTIADIAAYKQIEYFGRGIADYVPKNCLEAYPDVLAWMGRVAGHPKVAAYKASKAK